MGSNVINHTMDYKLIYKPSTVLEAITLTINVISMCISSPRIVCSWCSVDGSSRVAIYSRLAAYPLEMGPFGDHPSTRGRLTGLRSKPQQRQLG